MKFKTTFMITAAALVLKALFSPLQAQGQAYKVGLLPEKNIPILFSPEEVPDTAAARKNLEGILRFARGRRGDLVVVDGDRDSLVNVVDGKIKGTYAINNQVTTDVLSGMKYIPSKNNSWDRLVQVGFETFQGASSSEEKTYVRLKQVPQDKESWMSTRYNQLFNYLKLKRGIARDEQTMKEIVAFNVAKQYNIKLDLSKITIRGRQDNGNLGVWDVTYESNKDLDGRVIPHTVITRRDGQESDTKKGHILIQKDKEIYLPLDVIPRDRYPLEYVLQLGRVTPTRIPVDSTYRPGQQATDSSSTVTDTSSGKVHFYASAAGNYNQQHEAFVSEVAIGINDIAKHSIVPSSVGIVVAYGESTQEEKNLYPGTLGGFTKDVRTSTNTIRQYGIEATWTIVDDFKVAAQLLQNNTSKSTIQDIDQTVYLDNGNSNTFPVLKNLPEQIQKGPIFSLGAQNTLYGNWDWKAKAQFNSTGAPTFGVGAVYTFRGNQ